MKRALVIDDHYEARRGLLEVLKAEGYNCVEAFRKRDALHWLENEKVDLIITDSCGEPAEELPEFINDLIQVSNPHHPKIIYHGSPLTEDQIEKVKQSGASRVWERPLLVSEIQSGLLSLQEDVEDGFAE